MNTQPLDPKLEERLRELDPPYELEEQRQIGRILDYKGVPFFYRQATLVYDKGRHEIWRPDFTLPSYGGSVIEYAGNVDKQESEHKQQVYRANEIPAVFMYPNDLADPKLAEQLFQLMYEATKKVLEKYYRQTNELTRPPIAPSAQL